MADASSMHSLTSTLSSQPMASQPNGDQQHVQHPQHPQHITSPSELQNHGMPMPLGPPAPPSRHDSLTEDPFPVPAQPSWKSNGRVPNLEVPMP